MLKINRAVLVVFKTIFKIQQDRISKSIRKRSFTFYIAPNCIGNHHNEFDINRLTNQKI